MLRAGFGGEGDAMTLAGTEGQLKGVALDEAHLVRSVTFRASHHYRRGSWPASRNRRVFGDQTEPHHHDWRVEVEVAGPIHAETGWVVDLGVLDEAIATVTGGLDGAHLNTVIPEVATEEIMPSTEALARWIFRKLEPKIPAPARLARIRLFESPELGAAYPAMRPGRAGG
jgi:6-pyruvoyltetrahydropterin/6-carboxytetrahydropterin synthase